MGFEIKIDLFFVELLELFVGQIVDAKGCGRLEVARVLWKFDLLERPFNQCIGVDSRIGERLIDGALLPVLDARPDDVNIVAKDALEKGFVILFGIHIYNQFFL